MKTRRAIILLIVGITMITGCQSNYGNSGSGGGGGADAKHSDVEEACNNFVRHRLKSPATADFGTDTSTNVGTSWTVTGTVDSENGFGAQLRSSFTCKITETASQWKLDHLDFEDGGDVN